MIPQELSNLRYGYLWWPVTGQVNDYVPILQQELIIRPWRSWQEERTLQVLLKSHNSIRIVRFNGGQMQF